MGTRAVIAKPDGDGWKGRYHHWDGYPSGLGATLIAAKDKHFGGDLAKMTKHLIDDEKVGWSTINVVNPAGPPSWDELASRNVNPQSYTARGETHPDEDGMWIHSTDKEVSGAEWAYVLFEDGIDVYEGDYGVFGVGGGNFKLLRRIAWGDVEAMQKVD
jgi:hypothetical protein